MVLYPWLSILPLRCRSRSFLLEFDSACKFLSQGSTAEMTYVMIDSIASACLVSALFLWFWAATPELWFPDATISWRNGGHMRLHVILLAQQPLLRSSLMASISWQTHEWESFTWLQPMLLSPYSGSRNMINNSFVSVFDFNHVEPISLVN